MYIYILYIRRPRPTQGGARKGRRGTTTTTTTTTAATTTTITTTTTTSASLMLAAWSQLEIEKKRYFSRNSEGARGSFCG